MNYGNLECRSAWQAQDMSRRKDNSTAELVDIALLTRAAFALAAARRYAEIARLPLAIAQDIFTRPASHLRPLGTGNHYSGGDDRRFLLR